MCLFVYCLFFVYLFVILLVIPTKLYNALFHKFLVLWSGQYFPQYVLTCAYELIERCFATYEAYIKTKQNNDMLS